MSNSHQPQRAESLHPADASVNVFRQLSLVHGSLMAVGGVLVMVLGLDEGDEIVGAWLAAWMVVGIPQALTMAWLAARVDRRLADKTPQSRGLWLPAAAAASTLATWIPLLAFSPVAAAVWLFSGRNKFLDGALAGTMAWLIVAAAAAILFFSLRAIRLRAPGTKSQQVHWTDAVPTTMIGFFWVGGILAGPVVALVALLIDVKLGWGAAGLLGWMCLAGVGGAFAMNRLPIPESGRQEVMGAVLLGVGLPLFLFTLTPSWGSHDDQQWLSILVSAALVLSGTAIYSIGRGERLEGLTKPAQQ